MRKMLTGLTWITAAAAPAWAASDTAEQMQFNAFVTAAGAANGAARACGASGPDLTQHQASAHAHLQHYAAEYGFSTADYDALYRRGLKDGKTMMDDMKRSGANGCPGVLESFQNERTMSYEDMKAALAEVNDGLPRTRARK